MTQLKAKGMLKLYNSLTQKKEDFKPIEKGKVKLYTCGPTVYDYSHIGNFRTFLFEDLLKRVLTAFGYEVYHIMNITDVDDKTIKKANDKNKDLKEIALRYTEAFKNDIPYNFSIKILIDLRYIVSIIPHFAMYLNMPEKDLEFQIDFHSHKF